MNVLDNFINKVRMQGQPSKKSTEQMGKDAYTAYRQNQELIQLAETVNLNEL